MYVGSSSYAWLLAEHSPHRVLDQKICKTLDARRLKCFKEPSEELVAKPPFDVVLNHQ